MHIANTWSAFAVAWHVAIAASLAALVCGWRPTQRQACLLLILPLLSVSVFAFSAGNSFNGMLFAAGAIVLGAIGMRLADIPVHRSPTLASLAGIAMIGFAWMYPHFLEGGSAMRYLYAAPVGLIPCPTLSVVVGFGLLAGGLGSRAWCLVLAAMSFFYGLVGAIRLGVYLDIGLIAGAAVLTTVALRGSRPRGEAGPQGVVRP